MSVPSTIVLLATELPDPGSLSILALGSGLGGFVGGLAGRVRGRSREQTSQLMNDGAFLGFGVGCVCWLVAVAIDLL